jgi:hypothetical protein
LWEKEIRRARKESFRSQSVVVKLQEELKAARNSLRTTESEFEQQKERSKQREQEAFAARYQLVGVQEELANMIERVKLVEQERDALKTIAKTEEIARIAADGQIPLPSSRNDDAEFASPTKARFSLPPVAVTSSAASEEELEQLKMELTWERRRADRAWDQAQYMQVECQFRHCSCRLSETKGHSFVYLEAPSAAQSASIEAQSGHDQARITSAPVPEQDQHAEERQDPNTSTRQTVFIPSEGVFRTVTPPPEESPWISPAKPAPTTIQAIPPFQHTAPKSSQPIKRAPSPSRTPSCEPPGPATIPDSNTSLLSLIDNSNNSTTDDDDQEDTIINAYASTDDDTAPTPAFHTISTTTKIPLAGLGPAASTPSETTPPNPFHPQFLPGQGLSGNDALSPTMSREEALAQIRERRGRARSLAQGTLTPRKPIVEGLSLTERRDCSAPAVRSGGVRGRM